MNLVYSRITEHTTGKVNIKGRGGGGSRHRVSPGIDRAGEYLSLWSHSGYETQRNNTQIR